MEHAGHHVSGWRMPAHQIRDERLKVSMELLQLTLRDMATLPTTQQQALRQAVVSIQEVRRWCRLHRPHGGGG